jgi:hypothetical protein
VTVVKGIQAKVLLSHVKQPDTWFGLKYNMNLYRGCQHRYIYCDSRSECYQIEDLDGEGHAAPWDEPGFGIHVDWDWVEKRAVGVEE